MQEDKQGKPCDGRDWITSQQAADLIGMSRVHFLVLARQLKLTRHYPARQKSPCGLLRPEVEALARQRKDRYAASISGRQIGEIDLETAQKLFLTSEQAAALLGIARPTLYNMARLGRLAAFRATTDNVYGRLWFSRTQIENLRNDSKRAERRKRHRNDHQLYALRLLGLTDSTPKHYKIPIASRSKKIPRDWINTHQAAYALGVSRQRVYDLIRTGRLKGHHLWKSGYFGRYWYVERNDVEALLLDPKFVERRRRYFRLMQKRARDTREATSRTIAKAAANARRKYRDPFAREFFPNTEIPW